MFTLSESENRTQALIERALEFLFPPNQCCLIQEDEDHEAFLKFQVSNHPDIDPYHPAPIYSSAKKPQPKLRWK